MSCFTEETVSSKFESFKDGRFSPIDTAAVIDNTDEILEKGRKGPLEEFFDDIKSMCEMVKAWRNKTYTGIPEKTIAMITLTLVYVFFPIDIIPDLIPGLCLVDDAAMVGFCIKAARSDINDFRTWRRNIRKISNR